MIERRRVGEPAALKAAYEDLHGRVRLVEGERFYAWAVALAGTGRGERVLDLGCGRGGLVAALRAKGAIVAGLDLAETALRRARSEVPGVPFVCGDGERLPFRDGAFDLVLCLGNLEHFLDPVTGTREIARVLRSGGRAWVMLPNTWYSGAVWRLLTRWRLPDHHQPVDRFGREAEWRQVLEAGGLRVGRVVRYDKFKGWKRLFPRALAYHFLFEARRSPSS